MLPAPTVTIMGSRLPIPAVFEALALMLRKRMIWNVLALAAIVSAAAATAISAGDPADAQGNLPAPRAAVGPSGKFTAADYARHIVELKKKVPKEGFTVLLQRPFVVVGDESPEIVRWHSEKTVKWAVERLKEAYFTRDPTEILDIWLFQDKGSYEKYCKSIFGHAPTTPYGFYSHDDGALVMNIGTGGGTLVHEIVHPFMRANFPACPAWFNEGLGSLYEQCGEVNGRITGYTNWRLSGLQKAIRMKRVPSFETLCSTTDEQFYGDDRGTNYAQARYLCFYLQERFTR